MNVETFQNYANVIAYLESYWMLPRSVVDNGIAIFGGRLSMSLSYKQEKAHWAAHGASYFDEEGVEIIMQPGNRFGGDDGKDRVLRNMGITLTENGTAVVPMIGIFGKRSSDFGLSQRGVSTDMLSKAFEIMTTDDRVRRLTNNVHSPGGNVFGVANATAALHEFRQKKPVRTVTNELNASAAFHISSQADRIDLAPGSAMGSIGVMTVRLDRTALEKAEGAVVHVLVAGEFKADGHPSTEFTQEEAARIKEDLDVFFVQFKAAVKQGRGMTDAQVDAIADGTIAIGPKAIERGFADGFNTLDGSVADFEAKDPRFFATSRSPKRSNSMKLRRFTLRNPAGKEEVVTAEELPDEEAEATVADAKETAALKAERDSLKAERESLAKERNADAARREAEQVRTRAARHAEIATFVTEHAATIHPANADIFEALLVSMSDAGLMVTLENEQAEASAMKKTEGHDAATVLMDVIASYGTTLPMVETAPSGKTYLKRVNRAQAPGDNAVEVAERVVEIRACMEANPHLKSASAAIAFMRAQDNGTAAAA